MGLTNQGVVVGSLVIIFALTVIGANWALSTFGIIPIGFGIIAPAGVLFAGLAFTFRDLLHESGGRWWVFAAIAIGTTLSWFLEDAQQFAIASAIAFSASELLDFAIYSPLRQRGWVRAVALSNAGGFTLDSVLFLWLAFGSLAFMPGQLLGKAYMTIIAIALMWLWRRRG